MNWIDTHCHLYLDDFAEDRNQVIERAEKEGITQFYLPNIDVDSIPALLSLEQAFPDKCKAMMGLHPCSVGVDCKVLLSEIEKQIQGRTFIAIGEIGLDYYWDRTHISEQKMALEIQCQWALQLDRPVVIHSRDSIDDCIRLLEPFCNKGLRGVFHCFGGTFEQAQKITGMGFMLGIGGVVTYKTSQLAQVLPFVPDESLVLETDAPYLSPVPYRGKRNEPAFMIRVAERLAQIKGVTTEEMAAITTSNALRLFRQ